MAERFEATLEEPHRVEVPFDVRAVFGRARAPVRGTINGHPFRTTVAVYSGRYYLGFRREIREAAGIAARRAVTIELELDDKPREVDVPSDLAAVLDEDAAAKAAFDRLSFTHRREYAEWVGGAKREETRRARAGKAATMLRDGVTHP
ncbi:MAG TPA: YdeI/OmpD-associated family protein [Gaiellales bacterium]|nr:YdeI/OmpD-associated family protein [Gaiellales bacterium]